MHKTWSLSSNLKSSASWGGMKGAAREGGRAGQMRLAVSLGMPSLGPLCFVVLLALVVLLFGVEGFEHRVFDGREDRDRDQARG